MTLPVLQLIPEYRDYVWGGDRLRPGHTPTAEAWVVYEGDRIASGPLAGQTLAEAAREYGSRLLGATAFRQTGDRFPLLVKLLDSAEWLSLQVHPNDEQARRLAGPGFFGKTEAWYFIEAAPGAQLVAGVKPGAGSESLAEAIRDGNILDLAQFLEVKTGDTLLMRPGTIHALGPGLLVYEVQQTSDLTYRVFDWNRPQTGRRVLHIDKSIEVADPRIYCTLIPQPELPDHGQKLLTESQYFSLNILAARVHQLDLDTGGNSFHALTVIGGQIMIQTGDQQMTLGRFETALVPAETGHYCLVPQASSQVLLACLPD